MSPADSGKIQVSCPHCHKRFQVPHAYAGKRGKCTACQGVLVVPVPAAQAAPAVRPAAPARPAPAARPAVPPPPPASDLSELFDEAYTASPAPATSAEVPPEHVAPKDPRLAALDRAYERERNPRKGEPSPWAEAIRGAAMVVVALICGVVYVALRINGIRIPFVLWLIIVGFFSGLGIFFRGLAQGLTGRR